MNVSQKKPEVVVFAGPNGSGKSTFTELLKPPMDYINADEIKKNLKCTDLEAAQLAEKQREDYVEQMAKKNNVRDFASINELTVLSNLETHNAQMIREGRGKTERFQILKEIAEYQLHILNAAEEIKLIE